MNHARKVLLLLLALVFCQTGFMQAALPDLKAMLATLQDKKNKNQPFYLTEFQGLLDAIKMPAAIQNVLGKMAITITNLVTTSGIQAEGTTSLKGTTIQVTVYFVGSNIHIGLALPKGINFQKLLPELGKVAEFMDKLPLGAVFIFLSTHSYADDKLGVTIQPGLNFGATVSLTGLLQDAQKFMDILKKNEFLIVDRPEAIYTAVITPDIISSYFGITLPFRIGIDFTKKPFGFKDPYIRKIYSAPLIETLDMLTARFKISGGLKVELGSQKDVLEFRMTYQLDPKTLMISAGGQMNGMYKPAFGIKFLGLGPLIGLEAGIMATPPWLNNVSIAAGYSLGDVITGAQGIISFDLTNGNIAFDAKQEKVDIDQFVKLLLVAIDKIGFKIDSKELRKTVPTIEFTNVELKIVPKPAIIFGKYWKSGIFVKGGVKIGKFGGSIDAKFDVFSTSPGFSAEAQLQPLDVKIKDKTIFKISGNGPNNSAKMAIILGASLIPKAGQTVKLSDLIKFKILLTGQLEIPPIKFKTSTDMSFDNGKFKLESNTKLGLDWFTGHATVNFDPLYPQNFIVDMAMDQNFVSHVKGKVAKKVAEFFTGIFEIKSASFHTSGPDLVKGLMPSISMEVTIFNKNVVVKDLGFDFNNPDKFFKDLLLVLAQLGSVWEVRVINDTPYKAILQCTKAGIIPAEKNEIPAHGSGKSGCGGLGCPDGAKVKVIVPGQKEVALKTEWRLKCGSKDVRLFMLPVYKTTSSSTGFFGSSQTSFMVSGLKIGLASNIAISKEVISYTGSDTTQAAPKTGITTKQVIPNIGINIKSKIKKSHK